MLNQRITVPIQQVSNETTVQWINDSITGEEKFQMKINIEGFHQNEVKNFFYSLV